MLTLLTLLACTECAMDDAPGLVGTRDDVTTQPGTYAGYDIEACADQDFLVVVGTGSVPIDPEPIVADVVARFPSVHAYTTSLSSFESCRGGTANHGVWTNDYTDVDAIVEAIGTAFADQDGSGEVEVGVEYMAVAEPLGD